MGEGEETVKADDEGLSVAFMFLQFRGNALTLCHVERSRSACDAQSKHPEDVGRGRFGFREFSPDSDWTVIEGRLEPAASVELPASTLLPPAAPGSLGFAPFKLARQMLQPALRSG